MLPQLVTRVLAQIPDGTVTDLYAGVGLFAVALAGEGRQRDHCSRRRPHECPGPRVERCATSHSVHVQHLSVESYLQRRGVQRTDTLLLDPPQDGRLHRGNVGDDRPESAAGGVSLLRPGYTGA